MTNKEFCKDVIRKRSLWAGIVASMLTACAVPAHATSFSCTAGAQMFTAPSAGIYDIVAYGAAGGGGVGSTGGLGAEIGGKLSLAQGEVLTVDVGCAGARGAAGGGGGGTFVVGPGSKPLVIAGGGGGGGSDEIAFAGILDGTNGQTGTAGADSAEGGSGGSNGQGGQAGELAGGGGGGYYTDGGTYQDSGCFTNCGYGGSGYPSLAGGGTEQSDGGNGGFGGGGGGGFYGGGGGGGYSGGGGGDLGGGGGGGGGSYLDASATDAILLSGVETGNGSVTITEVKATVPEPGSLALFGFGMGLVGIGLLIPRKGCTRRGVGTNGCAAKG